MNAHNMVDLGLLWAHLLAMVGAFGGLYAAHTALKDASPEQVCRLLKCFNILMAVGLLTGFALYYVRITTAARNEFALPSRLHAVIGIKFLLLFGIGALAGISAKKTRQGQPGAAGALRVGALALLALAALLGLSLRYF